ncbi:MAG TPA: pyruvate ferredoxin oxidoreductase [Deltaproteobacteria bacterium]|nr:pyruvate ferredoxin oxidoreductase [Deltaproteobacteria bacterium]
MKEQIIISGIGGQGVLFLTRFFAEAAMALGLEVLTSEVHGMAMRGGTVISHVKVGGFRSPLIRTGQADVGLFLAEANLGVHLPFLREKAAIFVNGQDKSPYSRIDALHIAHSRGLDPASANLILLGFAMKNRPFFCPVDAARDVIKAISKGAQAVSNMEAFESGYASI